MGTVLSMMDSFFRWFSEEGILFPCICNIM